LGEYSSKLAALQERLDQSNQQVRGLEAELRNLKEAHAASATKCDFLGERVTVVEQEKRELAQRLADTTEALNKGAEAAARTQAELNAAVDNLRRQLKSLSDTHEKAMNDSTRKLSDLENERQHLHATLADKQRQLDTALEEGRMAREERSQKGAALAGEARLRGELEQQRDRLQASTNSLGAEVKKVVLHVCAWRL
jgi:chromosome segregation ATPase